MLRKKVITIITALSLLASLSPMASAVETRESAEAQVTMLQATPTATPDGEVTQPTPSPTPDGEVTQPTPSSAPDGEVTQPTPSATPDVETPQPTPTATPDVGVTQNEQQQTKVMPFTDVSSDAWYYDIVSQAYNMNLISGMSDTEFAPEGKVTGGQFVMMLYRGAGNSVQSSSGGAWYSYAVEWAKKNGIITDEGWTFNPEANLTREQMMVLLYNYMAYKGETDEEAAGLGSFTDSTDISDYALTAVGWLVAMEYIHGDGSAIRPQSYLTRAETCVILVGAVSGSKKRDNQDNGDNTNNSQDALISESQADEGIVAGE